LGIHNVITNPESGLRTVLRNKVKEVHSAQYEETANDKAEY